MKKYLIVVNKGEAQCPVCGKMVKTQNTKEGLFLKAHKASRGEVLPYCEGSVKPLEV